MAIRNGTTESGQIMGRNTERLFTTEVTEITEIEHEKKERFGRGAGTKRRRSRKDGKLAGKLWNGQVHAKNAELSE